MNKKKKLIYVGFSFLNHGEYAGYDQIKKYVNYEVKVECQKSHLLLRRFLDKKNIITILYKKIFGSKIWWVELKLIFISLFEQNLLFHFIYAENIYNWLGYFKRNNQIVLTLHQPIEFFKRPESKGYLKRLKPVDKIIVMSREMEIFFKTVYPEKDVLFIPHGIDTEFFKPKPPQNQQIFMVGNWLRDFEFANKVFQMIKVTKPNVKITILCSKENHSYFTNPFYNFPQKLTDSELLEYYQQSKIVFLPLIKFTANNALLEACASGCQVLIATDKSNIPVLNDSPILFVENDIKKVTKKLLELLNKSDQIEVNNRNYVENNFGWKKIGQITEQFLRKTINQ